MESRASTQLGENIKILTYVSIFFLPITVCTVRANENTACVIRTDDRSPSGA